ncbi:MAG: hypothetical protein M3Q07_17970 [Pseudobdellovibrionaceae bacterium]|nr:hypothetical protein [Pseudobdellovibrionaceae bacterium]
MTISKKILHAWLLLLLCVSRPALAEDEKEDKDEPKGNLVMFVGMDISGSFKNRKYFDDSIKFASHYLYAHLHGIGGLKVPHSLFVGPIGGAKVDEAKTFFPIQTFQYKKIEEIEQELRKIFPMKTTNKFTDFNAYFDQVSTFMKNRKLMMKPTEIILFSDGIPDAPTPNGKTNYKMLQLKPLENLTRKMTIRVLYTSAVTGAAWQDEVPRKRVRIWTQDDQVMAQWQAPDIFLKDVPFEKQDRLFKWIKDNVDFPVREKRVN